MLSAILVKYGVTSAIAVVAAIVGHFHGKRQGKASNPVLGPLQEPIVQLVFGKLVKAAHDSGHAALDGAILKMMPGLAPVIPTINTVVESVENRIVNAGTKT